MQRRPIVESALEESWFVGSDSVAEAKAKKSVAALVAHIHAVKPLPLTATRLLSMTREPGTSVSAIARLLEGDPPLAARILRLVNSSAFGLVEPCKSVSHAVSMLGTTKIAEIATAAALFDTFATEAQLAKEIIDHSVLVAAIAHRMSLRFDLRSEDVSTCALLHDLGKLMMLDAELVGYEALLTREGHSSESLHVAEREAYGFDHAVLAGLMLQEWHVPSPIPEVVKWHHRATNANTADTAIALTTHLLAIADGIAHLAEADPHEPFDALAATESASALSLTRDDFERAWPDISKLVWPQRPSVEIPLAETKIAAEAASCAECGHYTEGESCPRCARPLCPAHAPTKAWCDACEETFSRPTPEQAALTQRMRDAAALAVLGCGMIGGSAIAQEAVRVVLASTGMGMVLVASAMLVLALRKRWKMRLRFSPASTRSP